MEKVNSAEPSKDLIIEPLINVSTSCELDEPRYLRQEYLSYDPYFWSACEPTKLTDQFRGVCEKDDPNATEKCHKKHLLTLDNIPPEIRLKIFTHCVSWNGEYMAGGHPMPPLLIALRGHRPLNMYIEVLWLLYKQNVFYIQLPQSTARQFAPRPSVSRIERLTVSFDPWFLRHRYTTPNVTWQVSMQGMLSSTSSLRILHLDVAATDAASRRPLSLPSFLSAVRGLTSLRACCA